jgi:hypothetical protein
MSESMEAQILEHTRVCNALIAEVGKVVVGQEHDGHPPPDRRCSPTGHVLLEGVARAREDD